MSESILCKVAVREFLSAFTDQCGIIQAELNAYKFAIAQLVLVVYATNRGAQK